MFHFQGNDRNLQLLLPMAITVTCSGGPCAEVPAAACTTATCAASVYFVSSPTLPNETLVVAGAGLAGSSAKLCLDAGCTRLARLAFSAC